MSFTSELTYSIMHANEPHYRDLFIWAVLMGEDAFAWDTVPGARALDVDPNEDGDAPVLGFVAAAALAESTAAARTPPRDAPSLESSSCSSGDVSSSGAPAAVGQFS